MYKRHNVKKIPSSSDRGKVIRNTDVDVYARLKSFNLTRLKPGSVGSTTEKIISGRTFKMTTLSQNPPIFEIPNFLSQKECNEIIDMAIVSGLKESRVIDDGDRLKDLEPTNRKTFNIWDYNQDGIISLTEIRYNLFDLRDLYLDEIEIKKILNDLMKTKQKLDFLDYDNFAKVTVTGMIKRFHEYAIRNPKTNSRYSAQAWISHKGMTSLSRRLAGVTHLPLEMIENSEDLQVVKYKPGGHYHCHYDSVDKVPNKPCCHYRDKRPCQLCRYMTVLYFLNNPQKGGETAFPIADNSSYSKRVWDSISKEHCDFSRYCYKAKLHIKPEKGKAILWYNHLIDKNTGGIGQLDPLSLHGGCDVIKGEKWIANNWINAVDKFS